MSIYARRRDYTNVNPYLVDAVMLVNTAGVVIPAAMLWGFWGGLEAFFLLLFILLSTN
jgi:hypothetical protein